MLRYPVLALLVAALAITPGQAFGLKTHLWIAQRVLDDVSKDCKVTLKRKRIAIDPTLCQSMLHNPGAYLAGAIGPDTFPDIKVGQSAVHPGLQGSWQTSDWLRQLYDKAPEGAPLAFAAGYLAHASGDVFAHTYVNGYTGDVFKFDLKHMAIPLRHVVLEKYIDAHLPPGVPSASALEVPADYLRDKLIYDPTAADVSTRGGGPEIGAFYGVRRSADQLAKQLQELESEAGRAAGEAVAKLTDLQAQLADGETALAVAKSALDARTATLDAEQQVYDHAKQAFDTSVQAVEGNRLLLLQSDAETKVADTAIDAADQATQAAIETREQLEQEIGRVTADIAKVPASVAQQLCEKICKGDLGKAICDAVVPTCRIVQVVNPAYQNLVDQLSDLQRRLSQAEATIDGQAAKIAAEKARKINALQQKASAEAASAGLAAARDAADLLYKAESVKLQTERNLTADAADKVNALSQSIGKLRQQVVDVTGIRDAIANLIRNSGILSGLAVSWRSQIDVATSEYIRTSLAITRLMVSGKDGVLDEYARWLACYGPTFAANPAPAGQLQCGALDMYQRIDAARKSFILKILPEPFRELYDRYGDINAFIEHNMKDELKSATIALADVYNTSTRQFIDTLLRPENATGERLQAIYAEVGNSDGRALLTFPDVRTSVDADLGVHDNVLDPSFFKALADAVMLAKLALLDDQQLKRLIWELGGQPAAVMTRGSSRYSLLYQATRSIDGNQQWQPYGLPYPRSTGSSSPINPDDRHYGWGPNDGEGGLPIFMGEQNRISVFRWLFPEPMGGKVALRPEMQAPAYPFPSCSANPFPVAFGADGSPAASDLTCAGSNNGETRGLPISVTLRRVWRSFVSFLGLRPHWSS